MTSNSQVLNYWSSTESHFYRDGQSEETNEKRGNDDEPPAKKAKMRGRFKNKNRPRKKYNSADKLCPAVIKEQPCAFGDKCRWVYSCWVLLLANSYFDEQFQGVTYGQFYLHQMGLIRQIGKRSPRCNIRNNSWYFHLLRHGDFASSYIALCNLV